MNLNAQQLQELNSLLKKEEFKLPSFRQEVTLSGCNYKWLQKHLVNHPLACDRLKELLKQ